MALTAAQRELLIHRYEQGPVLLRDAFAQVPREAWKWRPAENKWSVYEIVCHCADSETNAAVSSGVRTASTRSRRCWSRAGACPPVVPR